MGLSDEIEYIANVNTRPLLKEEAQSTHIFELFWVRFFLTQMIFLFIFEVRISYGGAMETLEITSLSTKGQVVIPRNIRNQLNLDIGDKLIVVCDGSNILLKPVLKPSMSEFKSLIEETDKITDKLATTPEMLNAFIKENR